ncbi:MAG: hypothetical protein ACOX1I_00160 [Dethiobacteria bacterium]
MKISAVRSLIVISLVTVLVVAGTTMAWFTDDYTIPSAAEMVVGTLEFEVTDASVITEGDGEPEGGEESESDNEGQALTWMAGECKELSWTFKNTGTKTAFFRACPEGYLHRVYLKRMKPPGERVPPLMRAGRATGRCILNMTV